MPEEVLETCAKEMSTTGIRNGRHEMSHRSKAYDKIIKDTEAKLRKVKGIPDNYKVLFLQGGATLQFSMVP